MTEMFSFNEAETTGSNNLIQRDLHLNNFKSQLKAEITIFSDKINACLE
jgi:hypothetical protein